MILKKSTFCFCYTFA